MSRLYEYISSDPESFPDFMFRFREGYSEAFPDSGSTLVGFDSINQNTNSHGIELAEFGHAKVKENLPDINTAMFVDEITGIPMYAITKKQRQIFKCLDLTEGKIKTMIGKLRV